MIAPQVIIRHRGKIIAGAVLVVCGVLALVLAAAAALTALFNTGGSAPRQTQQNQCSRLGDSQGAGPTATGHSHKQQVKNAKMIAKTASKLDMPDRAALVALTAAAGETDMINVKRGDSAGPDSRGLFQQRKSWGSEKKRMNAKWATKSFLLGPKHDGKNHGAGGTGLKGITGWKALSISAAIHAVQKNSDPNFYTQYKPRAKKLAKQAGITLHAGSSSQSSHTGHAADAAGQAADDYCDDPTKNEQATDTGGGSGSVGTIKGTPIVKKTIKVLKKKLGTPYSFGGGTVKKPTVGRTSPPGWDCSSYLQMGIYQATKGKIKIARTTTQQMHDSHLKKVSQKHMQPGDLVFIDTDGQWGHVVMFLGHGKIIEEPHTGAKSRVKPLSEYDGKKQSVRRVKAADKDS